MTFGQDTVESFLALSHILFGSPVHAILSWNESARLCFLQKANSNSGGGYGKEFTITSWASCVIQEPKSSLRLFLLASGQKTDLSISSGANAENSWIYSVERLGPTNVQPVSSSLSMLAPKDREVVLYKLKAYLKLCSQLQLNARFLGV